MKTIAIISRKGGAGKTTLAIHLATAAEAAGITTAIFDLDPQASAAIWADRRDGKPPAVLPAQAPRLPALLAQAAKQEAGLVILDTAPHDDGIAGEAATQADAILIPCRPSSLDLDAIGASVRLARSTGRPAYVVINAAPAQGTETGEAMTALTAAGVTVSPVVIHQRKALASFIQQGGSAGEAEPKGKAADEINKLFLWICDQVSLVDNKHVTKLARSRR